jgi:hypothetical protein
LWQAITSSARIPNANSCEFSSGFALRFTGALLRDFFNAK